MASVVKRLRPRIVVPICVGSNPTRRPTKEHMTSVICSLVLVLRWMRTHNRRSLSGFDKPSRGTTDAKRGRVAARVGGNVGSRRKCKRCRLSRGAVYRSRYVQRERAREQIFCRVRSAFAKRMKFFEAKHVGTFNASDSRQSTPAQIQKEGGLSAFFL